MPWHSRFKHASWRHGSERSRRDYLMAKLSADIYRHATMLLANKTTSSPAAALHACLISAAGAESKIVLAFVAKAWL